MHRILAMLARRLPCRIIDGDNGEPYLRRYALLILGRPQNPWLSIYLHHFLASDPDRGRHDHPWRWAASLILSGHYYEETWRDYKHRRPLSLSFFGADHRHRVVLPPGDEYPVSCWTLFAHGRRVKGWGFYRTNGYLDYANHGHTIRSYTPMARDRNDNPSAGWWLRRS